MIDVGIKEQNAEKKKYLRQYKRLEHKADQLDAEIEAIRSRYTGRAITYSDMPKAHNVERDLSDYAAEVDELLSDVIRLRTEAVKAYRQIIKDIEAVDDMAERELMRLRYINGMTWSQIADKMHYSDRWVRVLHGRALAHFKNSSF